MIADLAGLFRIFSILSSGRLRCNNRRCVFEDYGEAVDIERRNLLFAIL
jgi:hypothetical protein